MRDILTKHQIPTDNLPNAVAALNMADTTVTEAICAAFGLNLTDDNALAASRYIAEAVIRLGDAATTEKVVAHVKRKMPVMEVAAPVPAPVETETVENETVAEEVESPVSTGLGMFVSTTTVVNDMLVTALPTTEVKRGRGRPKNQNNDFAKAVSIIESLGSVQRSTILDAIIASGIKKSSAQVYLWHYNKGKRP